MAGQDRAKGHRRPRLSAAGLEYVIVDDQEIENAIDSLKQLQRDDGGWAQLPELDSDAYATATALFALHQADATG